MGSATAATPALGRRERAKEARVEQRRRQLLDAAAEVMQSTGYHAMSMQLLADRADVSVGLIYQYFDGKEDILRALIQDILEDFRSQVPAEVDRAGSSPVARLTVGIRSFCEVIDAKRPGTMLAYREMKTLPIADVDQFKLVEVETTEPIRRAVQDGIDAGVFRRVDVELAVHNVLMTAHGWALKHWNLARRMSLDEYVAQQTEWILAGLRPAGGDEVAITC